jgi:hypothetical protein
MNINRNRVLFIRLIFGSISAVFTREILELLFYLQEAAGTVPGELYGFSAANPF